VNARAQLRRPLSARPCGAGRTTSLRAASRSIRWTSDAARLSIGIRRGFMASGISRTNSTWSRPLSNRAPSTRTWAARTNCRLNGRDEIP
jgi:hypothetical protein